MVTGFRRMALAQGLLHRTQASAWTIDTAPPTPGRPEAADRTGDDRADLQRPETRPDFTTLVH